MITFHLMCANLFMIKMLSIAVLRNQHLEIETLCYCNFPTITVKHWQNIVLHDKTIPLLENLRY